MCAKRLEEKDYIGLKYGRLTIISFKERIGSKIYCDCICDCGNSKVALLDDMKRGVTSSCGCLYRETVRIVNIKHGKSHTRLYRIWDGIKNRCYRPSCGSYKNYGGRGITMCEEWKNDFMAFCEWAMKSGYDEYAKRGDCTIERRDRDGNYEPSNCKWISAKEQGANKRNNVVVEYNGEAHILTEWARILGIKAATLRMRYRRGYRGEQLLSTENLQTHGGLSWE